MSRLIVLILLLSSASSFSAQDKLPARDWHLRIPLELSLGLNFAQLETESGPSFTQNPGSVLSLRSGLSLTRKETWGVAIHAGGMLDSYSFNSSDALYNIASLSALAEARLSKFFPLSREHHSFVKASCGYAFLFYNEDEERSLQDGLDVLARSPSMTVPAIIPEIGICKRFNASRMDISLRYQIALEDPQPAFSADLSTATSIGSAESNGNYLGLNFAYHFGFEKVPIPVFPSPSANELSLRADEVGNFSTDKAFVILKLWDNADVDGDTLSIVVNGQTVLHNHPLSKRKKRVRIDLLEGQNIILVIAKNEGSVSPNTASCVLMTSNGKKAVILSTSMHDNDVIKVFREY